jgi:VWFA-related protein
MKRTWLAGLALVALATALSAQQPGQQQQRPVFRAAVELIQVDVVVRDREGRPVRGLTADDFVVLDRRKPQQIATFKEIGRESDAPPPRPLFPPTLKIDVASNQTANSERLVVMVLDDLHGYRGRDATVKAIATKVVEELGPESTMALIMTSGNHNVEVTEDRSRLLASIAQFKGNRAVRRPMLGSNARRGEGAAGEFALQEFDANMRLLNSLERAARMLAANDGRRKAFVLVSENMAKDLNGIFGLTVPMGAQPLDRSAYFLAGDADAAIPEPPEANHIDLALLDMMDSMRRGNVATYSIDPRGHVSTQDLGRECFPSPVLPDPCMGDVRGQLPAWDSYVRQAQRGLEILSEASGGFAVVDTDDFTGGIGRILADLDNYYLLGFYTEDTKTKGYRPLEVQVRGLRDVTLRYRRGYDLGGKTEENRKVDPLLALSTGALPKTDLPLRLHASPLPGSDRNARVPIALELSVPRKRIEQSGALLQDDIRYAVLAVDMAGARVKEEIGRGANVVLRPRNPNLPPPETVTYQIGFVMNLAPGRYQLRASAMSSKTGDGGSVYLPVDVPDFTRTPLAVSALVLGYAGGQRVPVVASQPTNRGRPAGPGRGTGAGRGAARGAPAPPEGLPFPPTLDREFKTTDDVALYFEVTRKDRARQIDASVAAVDGTDRIVRRYSQTLPASATGRVTFRVPLSELGPGAFRLRATASDGINEGANEIGIVVR